MVLISLIIYSDKQPNCLWYPLSLILLTLSKYMFKIQSFNLCILFMIQYLVKIYPCNIIYMGVRWVSDMGGIFVEDLTRFVRSRPFLAYSRTLLHERFFYLHEFHGLKLKMEEHFSFTSLLFLSAISLQNKQTS